ncbi:NADH:flavin oxidoreductase [Wenxinia saemankumensis]|uniref:2,4-dienoyl-CoA reductase n=1 Tax=Wenxinia saemankumensis TaxID=1447782 RepID=A0A1M6CMF6_9RHOB|nr:NADH:flavin oxidoreductase [Wenxinia saemankumensis]SHI62197.1 2,4-dienoyl-CoA reductase [Wenxinia saemankumensis]
MTSASASADLFAPLCLPRGPRIANRFVLAPLTNTQSHEDGTLSEDEYRWLTLRATGGFGLVTTCASHVSLQGKAFAGQLGCFDDRHLPGLTRLADGLRREGAVSSLQIQHGGIRALGEGGDIVGPSDDAGTGARALTGDEVESAIEDFVAASRRAEAAGFDGVQIHAAHGYLIAEFLSPELNRRADDWGGTAEKRARFLFEILHRIRAACRPDFQIGVRLSPERFGLVLPDMVDLAARLLSDEAMDYLDLSLWDVFKEPEDEAFKGRSLMSRFTGLDRTGRALGVAGRIMTAADAVRAVEEGADYVAIGKAGILAHDLPHRIRENAGYAAPALPVTPDFLRQQGVGDPFVAYLRKQRNFVAA